MSHHHHSHGHGHHESCSAHGEHEDSCCCQHHHFCSSCGQCNCGCQSGGACSHYHEHQDISHDLLQMADDAWMELLKEKIKKQIESTSGDRLDQLAKLVSDSNKERWKSKMGTQHANTNFKDRIADFFSHHEG